MSIKTLKATNMEPQFILSEAQIESFKRDGFLHIKSFVPEAEMKLLDPIYNKFIDGQMGDLGYDFSDITGELEPRKETMSTVSIMVPSKYHPKLNGSYYEQTAESVANQLMERRNGTPPRNGHGTEKMVLDLDRFIAKKPLHPDAIFHWHQDKLYCSSHGEVDHMENVKTLTFSLALDDTTEDNGCIRYVAGSHKDGKLREHVPVFPNNREKSLMAITKTEVDETQDKIVSVPIKRGDVTVHNELVLHGSQGNKTEGWRRSYMLQFRNNGAVDARKRLGYATRSLNELAEKRMGTNIMEPVPGTVGLTQA